MATGQLYQAALPADQQTPVQLISSPDGGYGIRVDRARVLAGHLFDEAVAGQAMVEPGDGRPRSTSRPATRCGCSACPTTRNGHARLRQGGHPHLPCHRDRRARPGRWTSRTAATARRPCWSARRSRRPGWPASSATATRPRSGCRPGASMNRFVGRRQRPGRQVHGHGNRPGYRRAGRRDQPGRPGDRARAGRPPAGGRARGLRRAGRPDRARRARPAARQAARAGIGGVPRAARLRRDPRHPGHAVPGAAGRRHRHRRAVSPWSSPWRPRR